jgi:uncharacterized membrane protein
MDVAWLATRKRSFADAAYYSMVGGVITGLLAGAAGAADFLEIPAKHPAKKIARLHGLINVSVLGAYVFNVFQRRNRRRPNQVMITLSGLCSGALLVSAWYGAHMVYVHGMRVLGKSPIEEAPEIAAPGDAAATRAPESVPERVTTS